jgi:hypothetical protein
MGDPKTEELEVEQVKRELAERRLADAADEQAGEQAHERRADKHAYLRGKLAERARSEDEAREG